MMKMTQPLYRAITTFSRFGQPYALVVAAASSSCSGDSTTLFAASMTPSAPPASGAGEGLEPSEVSESLEPAETPESSTSVAPTSVAPTSVTESPVYALHVVLFDPDFNASSYVVLSNTLDLESISLDGAREFPGFGSIMAAGGRLLVANAESPVIDRFAISADLRWSDDGALSFANYGAATADVTAQFFLNERTAYLTLDVTSRVIWNPTDFEILGVRDRSALSVEPRDGLELEPAFNRTAWVWRGPIVRPFYYRDEAWFEFSPDSQVAVYDPQTHEEREVVSVPCPALENATQDEEGFTYFSTWNYEPTLFLFGQGPKPCVARFTPEGVYDRSWTPDLSTWTGGRHPQVFRYLRDGKAVASVLHDEEVSADWSAGYTPEVGDEVVGGNHFHLWMFDLRAETAQPIEGVESSNAQYHGKTIDGRSFVFVPYDLWGRSKVYELGADGAAKQLFETTGWVYDWVRVR
jgi:hypothetical protein